MSAILGVFGARAALSGPDVAGMMRAMSARGADRVEVWRDGGVALAVARNHWELEPGFSGPVLIAEDDDCVVAADATLYYTNALRDKLRTRGVVPRGPHPAHLIAAAYRAWGDECVRHLEGDWAFVLWNRRTRTALSARDFAGKRPLHYATMGHELVVASTIGGVVAHPRCPEDLNAAVLAGTAAGLLFSAGPETCYSAVHVLMAAHRMSWAAGGAREPKRFWDPAFGAESGARLSHDDAAAQLRDVLCTAALERVRSGEPNAVWMSGGWDSTAVMAAAQEGVRRRGDSTPVLPVSITYPEGDPGREDDLINAVAGRWQVPVHWLQIDEIPFLDNEAERAVRRDQPYVHLYEKWNTALAAGARAVGARVALDGNGGDQLFQNSDVFLADLFRSGRWLTLRREWRARTRGDGREFFRTVIQPNLPGPAHRVATALRGGRPLRHYLERQMPSWIDASFSSRNQLAERDRDCLVRPVAGTLAEREIDWMFTCAFPARAFSYLSTFAMSQGVELRSPLSDQRVIDLALSRPWWERSSGLETKRLLRTSMKGLLPDHVLAPRAKRTGITSGYSHAAMAQVFPRVLAATMANPLLLEDMGIVRGEALRAACENYPKSRDSYTRVNLFYTLQTELWLRAHLRGGPAVVTRTSEDAAEPARAIA